MNLYAAHARALGKFQAKQGDSCSTFLWNGGNPILFDGTDSSWIISPNTAKTGDKLDTGGFRLEYDLRFSALAAQFYAQFPQPTPPSPTTPDQLKAAMFDTPMGYLGALYKITKVEIAPGGLVLTIDANALQGA